MSTMHVFLGVGAATAIAMATAFVLTAGFDELTVGRINIAESDATIRMTIANRAKFPGDFALGKDTGRSDRRDLAGTIFVNGEGTDNGGFIYRARIGAKGDGGAGMSLTFDRFRHDQSLELTYEDDDGKPSTTVTLKDAPDFKASSMADLHTYAEATRKMSPSERNAYFARLRDEGKFLQQRVFLDTRPDRDAGLALKDSKGRLRMVLGLSATGYPTIQMRDERGAVIKTVDAAGN